MTRRIFFFSVPFFFLLLQCASTPTQLESASVVDWTSSEGQARLARATAKQDFFRLANHFEGQRNKIACGVATATIVLNSFRIRNAEGTKLPLDQQGFDSAFKKQLTGGFEPRFERYTQKNVFSKDKKAPKTEAQVYGSSVKGAKDFGFQLRQMAQFFRWQGLEVDIRVADGSLTEETLRKEAVENLKNAGDVVVVNYARKALGQAGGGHISPLGAYDEQSDSFLVMDVNPNKANWVWVTTTALVRAMSTYDTLENRGYLLVREKSAQSD